MSIAIITFENENKTKKAVIKAEYQANGQLDITLTFEPAIDDDSTLETDLYAHLAMDFLEILGK